MISLPILSALLNDHDLSSSLCCTYNFEEVTSETLPSDFFKNNASSP